MCLYIIGSPDCALSGLLLGLSAAIQKVIVFEVILLCKCIFKYQGSIFQVAEVVLQEVQNFDFSVIMQLVTVLATRPLDELKGIMCIVCQRFPLPLICRENLVSAV